MRGVRRPLALLLLGAADGNVSRLSKWWDLTYGIKASLDMHLLQMEPALSQGVQHRGEAHWGTGKDKMTGNTHPLCLNYNLLQYRSQQCHFTMCRQPLYVYFIILSWRHKWGLRNAGALDMIQPQMCFKIMAINFRGFLLVIIWVQIVDLITLIVFISCSLSGK